MLGSVERIIDVAVGVRCGYEKRFELRRRQQHAAIQHPHKEARVALAVGFGSGIEVCDRTGSEEQRQHGADAVDADWNTRIPGALAQPVGESRGTSLQVRVKIRPAANLLHHGDPGGHRQRIPRQRPGLIDRSFRRDLFHDIAAAAVSAYGQPAADDLPERGQIGEDAVKLLRAADA